MCLGTCGWESLLPMTAPLGTHGVGHFGQRGVATPPLEARGRVGAEGATHQPERRTLRHCRLGAQDLDALGRHCDPGQEERKDMKDYYLTFYFHTLKPKDMTCFSLLITFLYCIFINVSSMPCFFFIYLSHLFIAFLFMYRLSSFFICSLYLFMIFLLISFIVYTLFFVP